MNKTKHRLTLVLKIFFSAGLLAAVFYHVDWARLVVTLRGGDPIPLLLAFGFSVVTVVLQGARLQLLLSCAGQSVNHWRMQAINFTATFFDIFTPGRFGSDGYRLLVLGRINHSIAPSLAALLCLRIQGVAFTTAIAAIFCFFILPAFIGVLLLLCLLTLAAVIKIVYSSEQRLRFRNLLPTYLTASRIYLSVANKSTEIFTSLQLVFGSAKCLVITSSILLLFIAVNVMKYWFVGTSFSLNLAFMDYIYVVPLLLFVAILPFTIHGRGLTELAAIATWGSRGASNEEILIVCLTVYAITLIQSVIAGTFLLMDNSISNEQKSKRKAGVQLS